MDNTRGGWDDLVQFASDREEQNKGELNSGKSKTKGARELHMLSCSINDDKIRRTGTWQVGRG